MPEIVSTLVQVYVLREGRIDHELLLLRRAHQPAKGLWQPVWGHVEAGESAARCALREAREETGLTAGHGLSEGRQLDGVHPFFIASADKVQLSPCFLFFAERGWEPTLCDEHDAHTWVLIRQARDRLVWPGQRATAAEIVSILTADESAPLVRAITRIDIA